MRFLRLPGLAHILALVVLVAAAVPLTIPEGPGETGAHPETILASMPDCDMHGAMAASGADCRGMSLHCLSLVVPEPAACGIATGLIAVRHVVVVINAPSHAPESESPPPRV